MSLCASSPSFNRVSQHFFSDCPTYSVDRAALWPRLHTVVPGRAAAFLALPVRGPPASVAASAVTDDPRVAAFLSAEFWSAAGLPAAAHPFHAVATFLLSGWRARVPVLSALDGLVAQGGNPPV